LTRRKDAGCWVNREHLGERRGKLASEERPERERSRVFGNYLVRKIQGQCLLREKIKGKKYPNRKIGKKLRGEPSCMELGLKLKDGN